MSARVSLLCLAVAGCTTVSGELEHPPPDAWAGRATVPVRVDYVRREDLPGLCQLSPDRLVGCSILWPGERCVIYVARGLTPALRRDVLAHERAHCAGWVHEDHTEEND